MSTPLEFDFFSVYPELRQTYVVLAAVLMFSMGLSSAVIGIFSIVKYRKRQRSLSVPTTVNPFLTPITPNFPTTPIWNISPTDVSKQLKRYESVKVRPND